MKGCAKDLTNTVYQFVLTCLPCQLTVSIIFSLPHKLFSPTNLPVVTVYSSTESTRVLISNQQINHLSFWCLQYSSFASCTLSERHFHYTFSLNINVNILLWKHFCVTSIDFLAVFESSHFKIGSEHSSLVFRITIIHMDFSISACLLP